MTQENAGYEKRAHHKRTLNGADISYETICEDLPVTDENGEVLGTAFAYEYIREDVTDKQTRPVLFAWNGGPGSSAVWLHAGFLAPLRFQIEDMKHPEFIGNVPLEEKPAGRLGYCDFRPAGNRLWNRNIRGRYQKAFWL